MNSVTRDMWAPVAGDERYERIYSRLSQLREHFHSHGRLDDSNAKLDEVVKLLATYLAFRRNQITAFPATSEVHGADLIGSLDAAFQDAAQLECYKNQDGSSIFGAKPHIGLQPSDAPLAGLLLDTITEAVDVAFAARKRGESFDVLNEAFGHFVRDNFRSNIEDAQYLTPPEVVDFMVDLALHDMANERHPSRAFTVLDPCCGVGSFLAAFSHRFGLSKARSDLGLRLIGQDKVDRMVRLTKVNLALFDAVDHSVYIGNSLTGNTPLDALEGSVDLILTNPPFGARFDRAELRSGGSQRFPLLGTISLPDGYFDSELLFIDRAISLLKPGGRLLIVVPDGVVSAKGLPAILRSRIPELAQVRMVTELPSVTFAQAGTRTRTVVLYLQKNSGIVSAERPVFIARSERLGFEVSSRKGVQVKVLEGENDLPTILRAYVETRAAVPRAGYSIASRQPSAVFVSPKLLLSGGWTPNRLSAGRFSAVQALGDMKDCEPRPLCELATFESDNRRTSKASPDGAFISILHLIGDGVLDVAAALAYRPKTPGLPVYPGEVLLSKINPRIPRVLVVPDLRRPTLCSSEFEILRPAADVDAFQLAFLLLTEVVTQQISHLTTGTSASHNRVRSADLAEVIIPVPSASGTFGSHIVGMIDQYRSSYQELSRTLLSMTELRTEYQRLAAQGV